LVVNRRRLCVTRRLQWRSFNRRRSVCNPAAFLLYFAALDWLGFPLYTFNSIENPYFSHNLIFSLSLT
jgi:hypothetical protein